MEIYRKEYRKEYYIKNIEKFRNQYNDHKDSIAEYEKLYYHQNRTEIRDKQRAYFQKYYLLNKKILIIIHYKDIIIYIICIII